MLNKTMSSLIVCMMLCGFSTELFSQDAPRVIWETIMLTPDKSNIKKLQDNMRAHNIKYHKDAPYKAYVFNIATGPNIGKVIWQMGTFNFTDLDSRPSDGGHDEDWRDNVMPYVKSMSHGEYWKTDIDYSLLEKLDPEEVLFPLLLVRFMDVNKGKGYLVNDYLKKSKTTIEGIEDHNPWGVYDNLFRQGENGRHFAMVRFLKNWGQLDEKGKYKTSFIKVHGESEWQKHIDTFEDAFSNSWDEIHEFSPYMSGK